MAPSNKSNPCKNVENQKENYKNINVSINAGCPSLFSSVI
jgi:hypothetical protein